MPLTCSALLLLPWQASMLSKQKGRGRILFCRLTSATDEEYATRAACDLYVKSSLLLVAFCLL
jgi:hypothetical protein